LVGATESDVKRSWLDALLAEDSRFRAVPLETAQAGVRSRVEAALDGEVGTDDMVMLLRANERLSHPGVLNQLAHAFGEEEEVWISYGSCLTEPAVPVWPRTSFSPATWTAGRFRQSSTRIGEYAPLVLRARFLASLFPRLSPADLDAPEGARPAGEVTDLALFLCAIEAAGQRHAYPLLDTLVVKSLDKAEYREPTLREGDWHRQLEIRQRRSVPQLAVLDAWPPKVPVSSPA